MYTQEPETGIPSVQDQQPPIPALLAEKDPKRAPAKSRSMYTPIGPSESMLAQHFGFGDQEARSHSIDIGQIRRKNAEMAAANKNVIKEERPTPPPIKTSPQPPPSRSNSLTDTKSEIGRAHV